MTSFCSHKCGHLVNAHTASTHPLHLPVADL